MIIQLSDEIRVRGTKRSWQLEKRRKRKNSYDWMAEKYFQTLGEALGAACRQEIRLHPAKGMVEALKAIDQITTRYNKLLDDALASREAA